MLLFLFLLHFLYTLKELSENEGDWLAVKQLPYGERGFPGYPSFSDGIDRWDRERVNYDRDNPGFSESTGHFT